MSDARTEPEISPASVFLALFHAFVFRLPSFQQLDTELSHSYLQNWIGAERAASEALKQSEALRKNRERRAQETMQAVE